MPIKVLVADDSPTIRRRASATLTEAGYEVTCVESGEAAWALLEAGDACQVLLCDILMPGMDGYELCRRVKTDSRFSNLPVLLLRGTFEPWDQGKAENVGADGFITKPFDANVLLSTLSEVVAELVPGAAPSAAAAGSEATVRMPAVAPTAPAQAPAPTPAPAPMAAPMAPPAATASPLDDGPLGGMDSPLGGEPLDLGGPAAAAAAAGEDPFSLGDEPAPPPILPQAAPTPIVPQAPARSPEPPAPNPALAPTMPVIVMPPPQRAPAAPASSSLATGDLDDAMLDRLAAKVVARLSTQELQKIAWEVVPDVAEALIKKRLLEIESKLAE